MDLSPKEQRTQTLRALLQLIEAMAAREPSLVVLEDAHWSDPTTLELFDLVVDAAKRLPIMLLVTFRPEFTSLWSDQPHVETLALDHLGHGDTVAMVGQVAGGHVLPPEVIEQVAARTDGVPLFVEELTKLVLESGLLRQEGSRYVLDGALPAMAIPETLHDSLLERLDRLAPAKEVAQIGAAIGREFPYRLLAAVAPLAEDRLSEALDALVGSELIFARGIPPDATYVFKHALVQDAAYSTLLKSRRRHLHGQIVAALENDFASQVAAQPEMVARHATEAGLDDKAIDYWRKAGDLSVARAAMKEAEGLFSQALRMIEGLPAGIPRDERELELLLCLGPAQQAIKGSVSYECGRTYARARELAEKVGSEHDLIEVCKGQMYFYHGRTQLDQAREAAGERLRISKQLAQTREIVEAYNDLATVSFSCGAFEDAFNLCGHAIDLIPNTATLTYTPDLAAAVKSVLASQSQALAVLGYREWALAVCDRAIDMARASSHDYSLAVSLGNACFVDQVCGRLETLGERAEEMIAVATKRGFPTWLARGYIFRGWLAAHRSSSDTECSDIRRGLADLREIGARVWRPYYLALLADACGAVDRYRAGIEAVDQAMTEIEPAGERDHEAELHRLRGTLLLGCGDLSTAEACFMRALNIAREQRAKTWELRAATSLARLWVETGERAKARDLLAPVHGWFTEGHNGPDLRESATLLDALR